MPNPGTTYVQNSSLMSQITVNSAETSTINLGYEALDVSEKEWTNEKHFMYLRTMEESFVNELHCSMALLRGQARTSVLENKSFEQFQRKSVSRSEAMLEAQTIMMNPWIRHYRCASKHQVVEGAVLNSRQSASSPSRQGLIGDETEMSGQNFVNDDKPIDSCSARLTKRKQTAEYTNADHDQVVPTDLTSASDRKRKALNYQR